MNVEFTFSILFEWHFEDFCKSLPAVLLAQSAGWESSDLQEQFDVAYYLTKTHTSPLSSAQTLTVKDLLLSNLRQTVRRQSCIFLWEKKGVRQNK